MGKQVSIQTRLLSGSQESQAKESRASFYTDPPIKRVFHPVAPNSHSPSFYTDPPIKRVSQELYLIAILSSFYTDPPIKRVLLRTPIRP